MSIEIGFFSSLIIFLFIVLPGIAFRRGYYHGAFTRQFKFSGQGILTIAYVFVLGIGLNFIFIELYNLLQQTDISVNDHLDNYKRLLQFDNKDVQQSKETFFQGFYEKCRQSYWSYLIGIYTFSILLGFILSRIVLILGFDLSIRILRFNNDWQYIFDGRKLDMNKRILARRKYSKRIKYVFLDILTNTGSEKPQLYRGLLKNYEISDTDTSKLQSISIIKAQRWVKSEGVTGAIISQPKDIPGNLFTILGENILNVNCHYVEDDNKEVANFWDVTKLIYILLMAVVNISLVVMILFKVGTQLLPYGEIIEQRGFLFRLVISYLITSALNMLTPFEYIDSKLTFSKQNLKIQTIVFFTTSIILFIILKWF